MFTTIKMINLVLLKHYQKAVRTFAFFLFHITVLYFFTPATITHSNW